MEVVVQYNEPSFQAGDGDFTARLCIGPLVQYCGTLRISTTHERVSKSLTAAYSKNVLYTACDEKNWNLSRSLEQYLLAARGITRAEVYPCQWGMCIEG